MSPSQKNVATRTYARHQRGAALVMGLLLLLILTLLAISGMNTSTIELQMASNFQYSQNAFQAAEIGIERALQAAKFTTNSAVTVIPTLVTGSAADTPDTYATELSFDCAKDAETLPMDPRGYSMGEGTGFSSYHYEIRSTGRSSRGAQAVNVQDFYVLGPAGGCS